MQSGSSENKLKKTLRLFPSELNQLIESECKVRGGEPSFVPFLNPVSSLAHLEFPCYQIAQGDKKFCLLNVVKDSDQKDNDPSLPYIGELLPILEEDLRFQNVTLLLPMRQCRGFLHMPESIDITRREHIVLVQLNITAKSIIVHDSQSSLKYKAYPDCLIDIAKKGGYSYQYVAYDKQKDDVLCGYYVHQYICACLENEDCRNIVMRFGGGKARHVFFDPNATSYYYTSKDDYFSRHITSDSADEDIKTKSP